MSVKLTPSFSEPTLIFDRPILLLVEGRDDRAFAARQIRRVGDGREWHVHSVEGKSASWSDLIELALESDQFNSVGRAVGLMLDADTSASAAADQARHIFSSTGLAVPSEHAITATDGRIKTGFFVAPDGTSEGALEDLLLQSVDGGRRELAQTYIDGVSVQFEAPKNPTKAIFQAYLAGQVKHVKTVGVAVEMTEVLPHDHGAFNPFLQFLQDLGA